MSKKNKSTVDKLIMGAVVGAAVGSVIGAAVAPEKGEKTRKTLFGKFKNFMKAYGEVANKVEPQFAETMRKPRSMFGRLIGAIFSDSTSNKSNVREIPTEHEEIHR